MPNWVSNTLELEKKDYDYLKEHRRPLPSGAQDTAHEDFSLDWIIPRPRTKEECIKEYGEGYLSDTASFIEPDNDFSFLNWYTWNTTNWGCKWDIDVENITFAHRADIDKDVVEIQFSTPWSAPEPAYEVLCATFPDSYIYGYCKEENDCFEPFAWWNEDGEMIEEDIELDDDYEYTNKYEFEFEIK